MTTLVCRLAGPLQSWGEVAQFTTRGSLAYPTYSGLLGLCRAALGQRRDGTDDRTGQLLDTSWLRDLTMAVRLDRAGSTLVDYHTVSALDEGPYDFLSEADLRRLPGVPTGSGSIWRVEGRKPTVRTFRSYLSDAAFTWLVEGAEGDIARLGSALAEPHWQLSLGRKACVPDFPLVLGASAAGLGQAAAAVPLVSAPAPGRSTTVHVLAGQASAGAGRGPRHVDVPLGHHPNDGYTYRTRQLLLVDPPTFPSRAQLLAWAEQNLDRR